MISYLYQGPAGNFQLRKYKMLQAKAVFWESLEISCLPGICEKLRRLQLEAKETYEARKQGGTPITAVRYYGKELGLSLITLWPDEAECGEVKKNIESR